VKYAAAYGAHGHHIGSAEALVPTLREAFAAGGTHLVAVPVDYRENFRVLVEELGQRDRKASAT
jgi:acetolactate synthase-1/2/3 large subunit